MTAQQQDVAAARAALRELEQAVQALKAHFVGSVDMRRLVVDVQRVDEDIDLVAGPRPQSEPSQQLEEIEDKEYPADFWADAEDEGIGRR
jgi:hypothetical protein